MSTLKVGTIQNASGVEVYTAKAWVNFNGTGTVAIRASGNVSSITDNGTGDYTVNFATAMVDANYSIDCNGSSDGSGFTGQQNTQPKPDYIPITTACKVICSNSTNAVLNDFTRVFVSIFR